MSVKKPNLIAISYAKRVLESGSREQQRMCLYAQSFSQYHIIVFTRPQDNLPKYVQIENLSIYGTQARTRLGMVIRAIMIGRSILRNNKKTFTVSSQDPFETSLVGRLISVGNAAHNHIQIHGDVFNPLSYQTSLLSYLRKLYGTWSVRHVRSVRVVSQRIKRALISLGVKESAVTVLPIQASMQPFLTVGEMRKSVATAPVSFLYIGRFSPEKNLTLLLTAFAEIEQDCSLTLVGAGPEESILRAYIQKNSLTKKVTLKTWTEDVSLEMAEHDVLCLSSNHEGWAMVLQEAAAAGMGIVTTDVGCAGEFIEHQKNGLIVPVGDVHQFADAMRTYIKQRDFLHTMQKAAYLTAKNSTLSANQYVQKLVDAYPS